MGSATAPGDGNVVPATAQSLPVDARNTAPETVARYDYQYECVALTVLQRLSSDDLLGIVVERTTDVAFIPRTGPAELTSIKHLEPNQAVKGGWALHDLKERVLVDLHEKWLASDQKCTVAFVSNMGFVGSGYQLYRACVERSVKHRRQMHGYLVDHVAVAPENAAAFLDAIHLPKSPLPSRANISDVAVAELRRLLTAHGRDGRFADKCYAALVNRIREASTDTPDTRSIVIPVRYATLRGQLEHSDEHELRKRYLAADDLRDLVLTVHDQHAAQTDEPERQQLLQDPLFTGRGNELRAIEAAIRPGLPHPVAPVVLHGLTGCGKSSLAMHFASTQSARMTIKMIDASSRAGLVQALSASGEPHDQADELGNMLRGQGSPVTPPLPGNSMTLLILDGVESIDTLRGIIPRLALTRVLITTTAAHLDPGYTHIEVMSWTRTDSTSYVTKVLPAATVDEADLLAGALYDHPLAVVQAANYCNTLDIDVRGYLDRFGREPTLTLNRGEAPGHSETAGTAIRLTLATLAQRAPAACALLNALAITADAPLAESLFDVPGGAAHVVKPDLARQRPPRKARWIPRLRNSKGFTGESFRVVAPLPAATSWRAALRDPDTRDQAIVELRKFSLLRRQAGGLVVHPLVKRIVRESAEQNRVWTEVVLGLFDPYLSPSDAEANESLAPHLVHVIAVAEHAMAENYCGPTVVAACAYLGRALPSYGDSARAAVFATFAADVVTSLNYHDEAPSFFIAEVRLAAALSAALSGRIDEAVQRFQQIAQEAQEAGDETTYLDCLRYLSEIATLTERRDLAEQVLNSASPFLMLEDQPTNAMLYFTRAMTQLFRMVGKASEASVQSEWVLRHVMSNPTAHHVLVENAFGDAATLALDRGDSAARLRYAVAMLDIRRAYRASVGGQLRPDIWFIRMLIGVADPAVDCASDLRKVDRQRAEAHLGHAAGLLDEARELLATYFSPDDPTQGYLLSVSGRLNFIACRYEEAFRELVQAEKILRSAPEAFSRELIPCLYHLAQLHLRNGDESAAKKLAQEVYEYDLETYGKGHPEVEKDLEIVDLIHQASSLRCAMSISYKDFFPGSLG
ncbi:hypothetical protein [Amycolatopsis sp. NPDC059657]|uniref:hypothetical protein n=1 Tax=Amycolatopsis sp. NPDC059657 TaxID=3346899 RepID=UPI00366E6ABF